MNTAINQPQSIGSIFANGFRMYGKSVVSLFPVTILLTLVILLPSLLWFVETKLIDLRTFQLFFKIFNIVFLILLPFIVIWLGAVIIHQGNEVIDYSGKTYGDSFSFTLQKFPIYFVTALVEAFVVFIGMTLLVFPGIFLYVLLGFYIFCILFDNNDVITSLKHSAKLVWGNWWRCFFILLIIALVNMVLPFIANFALMVHPHTTTAMVLTHTIIGVALIIFIVPWATIVSLYLYHDLKSRALTQ